ncbi:hypothetical protein VPNG_02834 [Cytospora leucostoma]|uniref:Uncharacterized protein n=1 Tax=Cytospora leucostoma TaxID=1230097 RepID=A0A423XJC8_9PEZI|nr:hypothetical protein VPNG_02834 [Cytospora leucostoma]
MAITRLWFFHLRPNNQATDPSFLDLWTNILELFAQYTPAPGPKSSSQIHLALSLSATRPAHQYLPHHFLLQSRDDPTLLVLISSYPSLALCAQAEAAYRRHPYRAEVRAVARHEALRQLDMEDAEVVPALLEEKPGREGVTVTITSRNPLRTEIAEARSSSSSASGGGGLRGEYGRSPVLPTNREISGADAFELPLPPREGEGEDVFAEQRKEGRRWIRIRRGLPTVDEGVEEVFQLKEVLSR